MTQPRGIPGPCAEVALEAFENQEVPLEVLISAIAPRRDASRSPLFQAMFVLQNNPVPAVGPLDLTFAPLDLDEGTGTSKFDISLGFEDMPEGFAGSVEFNTDLFEPATIERFSRHYVNVIESIIAHPERRISELTLLTDAERTRSWRGVEQSDGSEGVDIADRTEPSAIHGAFEAQVRATPDGVALISGEEKLTYAELNAHANRLAHHLRGAGAGPEIRVGLVLDDPIHRIVAVLGVLKAGAAYVPIEPSLPTARQEGMLDAASVAIVIVDRGGRNGTANPGESDRPRRRPAVDRRAVPEDLSVLADDENLAYVVFTSGTSGRPKGVMISHRNLLAAAIAWECGSQAFAGLRSDTFRPQAFAFDVFTGDWVRTTHYRRNSRGVPASDIA